MADYIDRDAFIKHYRELLCKDCDKRKGMKNGKLKFCYEIGEAPCRACSVDDMLGWLEEYPVADVQCGNKWILTSERLPEHGETVLLCTKDFCDTKQDMIIGTFIHETVICGKKFEPYFEYGWGEDGEAWVNAKNVPAWMPLPELYNEGE